MAVHACTRTTWPRSLTHPNYFMARRLTVLVDGSALAEAVLSALPSCPPDLKGDLLCALADVAPEVEHEVGCGWGKHESCWS